MLVRQEIKCNATSEVRASMLEHDDDVSDFWWSEGNMACDCCRAEAFDGILGQLRPCGSGAFSVRVVDESSGRVIYDEFLERRA